MKDQQRLVSIKFGHIHLSTAFRKLLVQVKCEEETRYAINRLCVGKNLFAVTNGRQLLEVKVTHNFENGLYFVTKDGYCLKDESAGRFPKYTDIIPKTAETKLVWKGNDLAPHKPALIIFESNRAGSFFDLDMLFSVLKCLEKLDHTDIQVELYKKQIEERPILIKGELAHERAIPNETNPKAVRFVPEKARFLYVQMPVNRT